MARGNFRTNKDVCLYCGTRATATPQMYKRGLKNQPDYLCERCFDKNASDEEKQNREDYKIKPKLTKLQQELLDKLEKDVWVSDVGMKVNANTMWSLKEKGLIEVKHGETESGGFTYLMKKL